MGKLVKNAGVTSFGESASHRKAFILSTFEAGLIILDNNGVVFLAEGTSCPCLRHRRLPWCHMCFSRRGRLYSRNRGT